jgi:hypothetical protein
MLRGLGFRVLFRMAAERFTKYGNGLLRELDMVIMGGVVQISWIHGFRTVHHDRMKNLS